MAVSHDTVYLKGDRDVEVQKTDITLSDIVSLPKGAKSITT